MTGKMKAAVFKDIEDIVVEERDIPACPRDGLLVRVMACGICGSDVRNYHNGLRDGIKDQIMGHEIAGQVVEVGGEVTRFKPGDRIALAPDVSCGHCWYCKRGFVNLCQSHRMLGTHFPGGYAQYLALPSDVLQHGFIEKIPEGMSYDFAAFAETAAAVVACQKNNNISLGDTVCIIGDGPVGCLHIEVARARGAKKIIMAGMDKLDLARNFGADCLFKNTDPERVKNSVLELTDGIGADIVICAVPSVAVQEQALEMVRKRGRVVIYGGVPKTKQTTQLNSNLIHYNEVMVLGAFSYPATGLADALSCIQAGQIHPEKYISAHVSLNDVVKGMNMVTAGKALKVMIDPWLK
jgi:L-iditol 2-dehydrogenase